MENSISNRPVRKRGALLAFVLLVVAALSLVLVAWFHTPVVVRESPGGGESETLRCANAGPSRWDPPTVSSGQEISSDANMVPFSLQVMKNDLEWLNVRSSCDQARDAHTNNLIVATFAAGTAIVLGYVALNRRRWLHAA